MEQKDCIKRKMIEGNYRYCNCNCEVCKDFKCDEHKGCGKDFCFEYDENSIYTCGKSIRSYIDGRPSEKILCTECSPTKTIAKKGCGKQIRNKICGERYFYKDGSYFDAFCEKCSPTKTSKNHSQQGNPARNSPVIQPRESNISERKKLEVGKPADTSENQGKSSSTVKEKLE